MKKTPASRGFLLLRDWSDQNVIDQLSMKPVS